MLYRDALHDDELTEECYCSYRMRVCRDSTISAQRRRAPLPARGRRGGGKGEGMKILCALNGR